MNIYIALSVFSFLGFALALYVFERKTSQKVMVCPIGADCHSVIHSDYSKFLGIRVEILGIFYYILMTLGYVFAFFNYAEFEFIRQLLFVVSCFAFLFSIYLTFVQVAILRQFCSWCLISAFFCLMIFALSLSTVL